MPRQALFLMLIGLSLAMLPGCSRKKPTTAPQAPVQEVVSTAPAPAPEPPAAPEPAPESVDPLDGDLASVNEYVRSQGLLDDVFYSYDSFDLTEEARQRLAANAQFFNRNTAFEAVIEGHCDERGTPEYNLALGERRASSARSYLTSLGVDGSRLRTITYGEERPVCTGNEEACWSQNRRAHFLITGRRGTD
ncbi:MAG TPA: peptidoglycan-associated lipoprotein Pal [Thermoanaerobaculia bacterium]|nr:peptidoglycan-associated lipoprotein Pal [Thermoanaerobaculia bacterium]